MVHCFASLMPSQFQVWTWGVLYPSVISSYVCHSIQISVLHFFFGLCVLGGVGGCYDPAVFLMLTVSKGKVL
jgi:hypothetical protein